MAVNVRLSDGSHAARLEERGIEISVIPSVGRLRRLLGAGRMQRQFVADSHLDVLQVETPPVGRNLPVPTAYSVHDLRSFHKPLRALSSSAELLERLYVKTDINNADVTLTLSEASRNDIVRYASDSAAIEILPAPVNPAPDEHPPRPAALVGHRRFVLALGHLEQRKNLEVLVRAATSASWPSDTTLVLAGADHGSAPNLRHLAERHGANVVFTGTVTEEDKWALLTHAEVVAVPSLVEGFGIVAVEAALAGTPALVSDRTSLPGIYNMPEIVVAADDPEAWAQAISRVVTDAEWTQSLITQQFAIASDYGPDAVARQLVEIYRSLLAPSRPR